MSVSRETSVRREHDAQVLRSFLRHRKAVVALFAVAAVACALCIPAVKVNYSMTDYLPADAPSIQALETWSSRSTGASRTRVCSPRASTRPRPSSFPATWPRRRRGRGDVAGQRGGHEEAARRAGRGRDGVVGDRRRVSVPAGHRRGERGDGHRGGARGRPGYGRVAGVAVGRCREHRQRAKSTRWRSPTSWCWRYSSSS